MQFGQDLLRSNLSAIRFRDIGIGGIGGRVVAGGNGAPVFVGPEPVTGMGEDVGADDVHNLLSQGFYDLVLVLCFVVGRGLDDVAGARFVFSIADGDAEGEDDFGSGAVGEVGGGGGYARGHAEKFNPDAAFFFCGFLIKHECGFSSFAESADQGAQGSLLGDDGLAGAFAQGVELFVDCGILGDGRNASHINAAQAGFESDQFPVSGVGGYDELCAFFEVGTGGWHEGLVFFCAFFGVG